MGQVFQALLDGLGWVLARIYDLIPNYGVAIIVLTLIIRVLLLPLAVKQIRSMQAMQRLQPKIKELQKKYKGNRQKLNEEMMKLYQEYGYNPLSGCLPLILQFPVLIALFAVLSFPKGLTHIPHSDPNPIVGTPQDSRLYVDIIHQHMTFLGVNLVCSPREAGQQVKVDQALAKTVPDLTQASDTLDCGRGVPVRIGYYVLLALMVATTYYQQRQMQKASPGGSGAQQQQMLARIMPVFFGFIGFSFPAGLILYWTTTNAVQIVQQHFMFVRRAQLGAEAEPPRPAKARTGFMANLRAKALEAQQDRSRSAGSSSAQTLKRRPPATGSRPRPASGSGSSGRRPTTSGRSGSGGGSSGGKTQGSSTAKPSPGGAGASGSGGGSSGGDRKKRRKR